jgi:acyl-CoA synthetase (NDP forming)
MTTAQQSFTAPTLPSASAAVTALLNPRSVALIGASADEEKFSGQPLKNLLAAGFTGDIYPVNPRGGSMNGIEVLKDIDALPTGVDVGLVMVPAKAAIAAVAALGDRGVTTAVVAVSGFAELGTTEGHELQRTLKDTALAHNIRLVGPNTNGIYNTSLGFPLGYNYVHSLRLKPGKVGLISHSGAMLGGFLPLVQSHGQSISTFVSCGNEVDLSLVDYVRYLIADEETTVIALIMDGIEDGREFRNLIAEARNNGKSVVALKLGNSASGTQATQAHSSRLAGSAANYRAIFEADSIVSVPSLETLALACAILADGRVPQRKGAIVASSSGAGSIMIADALTEAGLVPPVLSAETVARVTPFAGFAQVINPFDSGAAGSSNEAAAFTGLAGDEAAGFFLSYLNPVPTLSWRRSLAEATALVAQQHPQMPVIVTSPAPLLGEEAGIYREAGIPVVSSSLDAITVIKALAVLADDIEDEESQPKHHSPTPASGLSLSEPESKAALRKFGVVFAIEQLVSTAEEALAAAQSAGFPVVLKAAGPKLTHKTENNLVSINVGDEESVVREFDRLDAAGRALDEKFEGVVVAQQIDNGVEAVIGITVDHDFGPMVLVGSGGILAELVDDVAIAPAPLNREQASRLLGKTKIDRLINGYRGSTPLDRDSLVNQIVAVSEFAIANADTLEAVDLNPVRVLRQGAIALDALVIRSRL